MKKLIAFIICPIVLISCLIESSKPECSTRASRIATFNPERLFPAENVVRFAVYRITYFIGDEPLEYEHISGDSLVTAANEMCVQLPDSASGRYEYWDSLALRGAFYNITALMFYAEFEDGSREHTLTEALSPIESISEAWLCAETELEDHTAFWSDDDDWGQFVDSLSNGEYQMRLPYFISSCNNEVIGLLNFTIARNGTIESIQDEGRIASTRCRCQEALP